MNTLVAGRQLEFGGLPPVIDCRPARRHPRGVLLDTGSTVGRHRANNGIAFRMDGATISSVFFALGPPQTRDGLRRVARRPRSEAVGH
jgi:hypothetical protein